MCIRPMKMLRLATIFAICIGFAVSSFSSLQTVTPNDISSSLSFLVVTLDGEHFKGNFSSIQEAINNAENGSTVYVPSFLYYEHVIINKTVSLVGENVSTTIIDGSIGGGKHSAIVKITADNVTITGFTVQKSGWGWHRNGIYVYLADNCEIINNHLLHNCQNIRINCSRESSVINNTIARA